MRRRRGRLPGRAAHPPRIPTEGVHPAQGRHKQLQVPHQRVRHDAPTAVNRHTAGTAAPDNAARGMAPITGVGATQSVIAARPTRARVATPVMIAHVNGSSQETQGNQVTGGRAAARRHHEGHRPGSRGVPRARVAERPGAGRPRDRLVLRLAQSACGVTRDNLWQIHAANVFVIGAVTLVEGMRLINVVSLSMASLLARDPVPVVPDPSLRSREPGHARESSPIRAATTRRAAASSRLTSIMGIISCLVGAADAGPV